MANISGKSYTGKPTRRSKTCKAQRERMGCEGEDTKNARRMETWKRRRKRGIIPPQTTVARPLPWTKRKPSCFDPMRVRDCVELAEALEVIEHVDLPSYHMAKRETEWTWTRSFMACLTKRSNVGKWFPRLGAGPSRNIARMA